MLGQTFAPPDLFRLFTLTFLEIALSIDNGLALALIVRPLPAPLKKKALLYGVSSAFALRAIGVLFAAYFIDFFLIQILGSLYLLYFSIIFFVRKQRKKERSNKHLPLWKAIILVELTDFVFAIDSILAGLALIGVHSNAPPVFSKIWIIYFGGIIGIIAVRFASKPLTRLIDWFPGFEVGAHLMVGWVGLKLFFSAYLQMHQIYIFGFERFFWLGIFVLFSMSFVLRGKTRLDK